MKKGKIILSVAATICAIAGAFTTKSTKFSGGHMCYTTVVLGNGNFKASGCMTRNGHSKGQNCCDLGVRCYTQNGTKSYTWCTAVW
jgi:hypothetical protein